MEEIWPQPAHMYRPLFVDADTQKLVWTKDLGCRNWCKYVAVMSAMTIASQLAFQLGQKFIVHQCCRSFDGLPIYRLKTDLFESDFVLFRVLHGKTANKSHFQPFSTVVRPESAIMFGNCGRSTVG